MDILPLIFQYISFGVLEIILQINARIFIWIPSFFDNLILFSAQSGIEFHISEPTHILNMDNSGTNVDQPDDSATEDSNPRPHAATIMESNPEPHGAAAVGLNPEIQHDEEEDEDLYFNVKDIDSSCDLPPLEIPQYDFGFDSKKS